MSVTELINLDFDPQLKANYALWRPRWDELAKGHTLDVYLDAIPFATAFQREAMRRCEINRPGGKRYTDLLNRFLREKLPTVGKNEFTALISIGEPGTERRSILDDYRRREAGLTESGQSKKLRALNNPMAARNLIDRLIKEREQAAQKAAADARADAHDPWQRIVEKEDMDARNDPRGGYVGHWLVAKSEADDMPRLRNRLMACLTEDQWRRLGLQLVNEALCRENDFRVSENVQREFDGEKPWPELKLPTGGKGPSGKFWDF
jgi:hypothetical protein